MSLRRLPKSYWALVRTSRRYGFLLLFLGISCLFPLQAQGAAGKGVATFVYGDREPIVPGLKKAWGFSALLEYDGKKILFNGAGVEAILKNNMTLLKIDPKDLDAVVVSHEHWEMVKGFDYLFAENPALPVFVTEKTKEKIVQDHPQWEGNFQIIDDYQEFTENIVFLNLKSGRRRGGPLGIEEINIVFKTDQGLVLFVGCGHPELLQVLHHSKQLLQESSINLLAGGMHLLPTSTHVHIDDSGEDFFVPQGFRYTEDNYRELMTNLKDVGVTHVMPTHCTMEPAESIFKESFGSKYIYQTLGMRLEFPIIDSQESKDSGSPATGK